MHILQTKPYILYNSIHIIIGVWFFLGYSPPKIESFKFTHIFTCGLKKKLVSI